MKNLKIQKIIAATVMTCMIGVGGKTVYDMMQISAGDNMIQAPTNKKVSENTNDSKDTQISDNKKEIAKNLIEEEDINKNNTDSNSLGRAITNENSNAGQAPQIASINPDEEEKKSEDNKELDSIKDINNNSNEVNNDVSKPTINNEGSNNSNISKPNIEKPNSSNKPNSNVKPNINTKPNININNKPSIDIPTTNKPNSNKPSIDNESENGGQNNNVQNQGAYISEIEQLIFNSVNSERINNGLSPLSYNNTMQKYARIKSNDMGVRNYFDHKDPEGNLITVKMKNDGVTYNAWGENIAYISGMTGNSAIASKFMNNWMNSPGHRQNILSTNYTSIGVGVYKIGNKYYATQEFYK